MDKADVFDQAWESTSAFKIGVSVEHGAILPEHLLGLIVLDVGQDIPIPTDVVLDDDGIRVELRFSSTPFECFIPWHALHAIATDDWAASWTLREEQPVKKAAGLKLVK
jgi:hypothetical protein